MKESGIEWIGEIPINWEVKALKLILAERKENNNPIKTDNILSLTNDRGVILYNEKGAVGNKAKEDITGYRLAYPNDIVLNSMNVIIGSVGLSKYFGAVSPVYYMLYIRNDSDSIRYYNYVFKTEIFQKGLRGLGNGILELRMRIPMSKLNNVMLPVPPVQCQQHIADYLDQKCTEIDSIIEKTKASIEEYKAFKQSVITEAVTKGLDPNVPMKGSGVAWNRTIPAHWEVVNGRRLFALRKDKAVHGERQLTASQKHGIIYQDDFMRLENQKVVTVEKDFSILKHVEPNDFVISMRSFQGGLEYSELSGSISSAYVMLIPNEKVYPPYFKWLFKSAKYINALQSTSNLVRDGQAMRYSNFVQIPLFSFPIEEQKAIAMFLDRKCGEIDLLIEQKINFIEEIETYKKSLIYECVTGKREV